MQWIIKAVGSILVIISSTMVGYAFSRQLTERIECIREIQGLLMELENEIHYMARPLGQAFLFISQCKTGRISQFTKTIYDIHREEVTIEASWQKSVHQFKHQWALHEEEWKLLFSIGDVLGKTDRVSQRSFIQMMREKFAFQEKKADEDRTRKEKLYKTLGALGGLAMVIVLI